jgi:hypothetical protein
MGNHRDATADLRLFEVVHEIPLLYPIGGASPAEPAGTTVDGPCCPGVESALLCDLCCHFAIRSLMADAAQHCGHDPDRVSFVAALRITRQSVAHRSAFPPDDNADMRGWLTFLRRLIARLNPARRPRAAPRVIKRKMPKWHVKRAHHAGWPQPQQQPSYTAIPP